MRVRTKRWYWVTFFWLDKKEKLNLQDGLLKSLEEETDWWLDENIETNSERIYKGNFLKHINFLNRFLNDLESGDLQLGRRPKDLLEVLCDLAIAGPGTCGLRALKRVAEDLNFSNVKLLEAATQVGFGFRTLFNKPINIALLEKKIYPKEKIPYWRKDTSVWNRWKSSIGS